jgi:hypothetical protein
MLPRLRSAALIGAIVLMGISWSFALVRIKTDAYPYLWSAALPLLAFYFSSGPSKLPISRRVPAGMVAIYTLVLWRVTQSQGLSGALLTVLAGVAGAGVLWLGARLQATAAVTPAVTPAAARRAAKRARTARASAGR